MRQLISWIGRTDLKSAAKDQPECDPGAVLRLLRRENFDMVHLLNDIPTSERNPRETSPADYMRWLAIQCGMSIDAIHPHHSPENLRNQYDRAFSFTQQIIKTMYREHPQGEYALLLTPGYPAAQVAMVIAVQTLFDREPTLYNTFEPSPERQRSAPWQRGEIDYLNEVRLPLRSGKSLRLSSNNRFPETTA